MYITDLRSSLPARSAHLLRAAGVLRKDLRRAADGVHLHRPQVRCARAHDQTVAEDYFAAMERVEQRLEIVPAEPKDIEVVKVQEPIKLFQLIEQLEIPELCYEERLGVTSQLRKLFGAVQELEPIMVLA
jgi:hypothetical protein